MILDLLAPPLCWSCKAHAARGSPLCHDCRGHLRFLPRTPAVLCGIEVWAPVAYDGPARELVRALKFRGAPALASTMGALIVANGPPGLLAGALVPVPLHPARRLTRPYNQALLIAEAISARTHLPVVDCLRRVGDDRPQVGRSRAARLTASGAVEMRDPAPPDVVLVDDVATTGGTLAACAHALRSAGTQHVVAIAFARTAGR